MCGIYGAVSFGGAPVGQPDRIGEMGRLLCHRGPHAHGVRSVPGAVFGAERLRVFDPSPAGDQPLTSPDGEVWVVLNGAIYNAPELRRRCPAYPFRSRCDAETIVPLYLELGAAGLSEIDGMFAIAIYDARSHLLVLARDRAGEKPLFFSEIGKEVWFASEIQALLALPSLDRELNTCAVRDFVTLGYVIQPKTMFKSVSKVGAGTILTFSTEGQEQHTYWAPQLVPEIATRGEDAVDRLETLLVSAVRKQLAADAPVGIFTSGGVDSSLLAAFAAKARGSEALETFSVGFPEPQFDESPYARQLSALLGTKHHEVIADERALSEALGVIVANLAEPSADPAILPTYLLACRARDHVTVVLGGEGADELFGGYPTYLGHRIAPWFQSLPVRARRLLLRLSDMLPPALDEKVPLEYLLKRFLAGAALPVRERHVSWFGTGVGDELLNPDLPDEHYAPPPFPNAGDAIERACEFDYCTYLRENLLMKVDRATMLAAIEARAPYLDRDVTAFAMSLRSRQRVRGLTTKWVLKRVARRWLPRAIVARRKRGLSVPVATWLNGGLKLEADMLLSSRRIERQGLLHSGNVGQLLSEHRSGHANHGRALWALLMLQYWLERWIPERCQ